LRNKVIDTKRKRVGEGQSTL